MGICRWLGRKEEVSLFDNGLRIESNLKILCGDKWQGRYVVCQRRCLSEAPLIGIFKNGSTREKGQHLELFYLQNYIGYEYGFKFKGSNKTLAILVQGQTLIFSFTNVESMVFWKEWLKDVCGRSAVYFVRIHSAPKDTSIIRLSSRNARIHITRYALVVVQEIPPKQRLYLNLEDISDVECVQNRFVFRALAYPWAAPQSFMFTSDQIPELNAKLQCLLKAKQYFNHSNHGSRLPSLKNSSLGQVSSGHQPHQQQIFSPSPLYANDGGRQTPSPLFASLYANEDLRRSSSGASAGDLLLIGGGEDCGGGGGGGPPPLKKKSVEEGPYAIPVEYLGSEPGCVVDFADDDHLLLTVDPTAVRSRGSSHARIIDDFQFIEGTPAQFLNQQLVVSADSTAAELGAPPPGLVKPAPNLKFLPTANGGPKLGKSLSRKLKRQLTGSYTKYDGDKSSISYMLDDDANSSGSGRKVRPKKSLISSPARSENVTLERLKKRGGAKTSMGGATTKGAAASKPKRSAEFGHCRVEERDVGDELQQQMSPPPIVRSSTSGAALDPNAFDTSVASSVRIDSAVQRGSERLKEWSRKSSTSTSRRNSSMDEEEDSGTSRGGGSRKPSSMISEVDDETEQKQPQMNSSSSGGGANADEKLQEDERSVSTGTNRTMRAEEEDGGGTDDHTYSGSMATTVQNLNTPMAASLNELSDPGFVINERSATNLARSIDTVEHMEVGEDGEDPQQHVYEAMDVDEEDDECNNKEGDERMNSSRSLSVCSELNARIIQRGGRNRASGRSNNKKDRVARPPSPPSSRPPPVPPRKQSSQPCFSKAHLSVHSPDDDYVDIDNDAVNITPPQQHHHHKDNNNEYVNSRSVFAPQRKMSLKSPSDIEYIQICPAATSALRNNMHNHRRGGVAVHPNQQQPMKRSNSLYDFLLYQQHQQQQQRPTGPKPSSEAEYYATAEWSLVPPRASSTATTASSHLTHALSRAHENLAAAVAREKEHNDSLYSNTKSGSSNLPPPAAAGSRQ